MRKQSLSAIFASFLMVAVTLFSVPGVHASTNVTWSSFQQFTSTSDNEYTPFVLQALGGTVWLFWEQAPLLTPWLQQIRYRTTSNPQPTFNASQWTPDQILVSNSAQNVAPRAAQLGNGTVFLSYSSNRTGSFEIFLKRYNPGQGWSQDFQLTADPGDAIVSSLVAARDGSLWVFWDRQNATASNIFYKYYRGGAWSREFEFTFDTGTTQDMMPSAVQLSNGNIFLAWSKQSKSFLNIRVWYSTFNGASWSTPAQYSSTLPDRLSAVTQDANNSLWMFWTREYQITGGTNAIFEDDIVYSTSTNNGNSWSPETLLTDDRSCTPDVNCYDDFQPTVAQLKDGRMYAFWISNRDALGNFALFYAASSVISIHNVAVKMISAAPLKLRSGGMVTVNVTVMDVGTFTETMQVNVVATNKTTVTVGSRNVTLAPGASATLSFTWNTAGVYPGKYTITASIPPVPGEGITNDNTLSYGTVWLVPPGDVDIDGKVDIIDAALIAYAYGTTPGMPNWNPAADLDGDGKINIIDASIMAYWFGTAT